MDKATTLRWRQWYLTVALAVGLGGLIVSAWVLPAIRIGGSEYAEAILWRQSAGRVVKSFAHGRPIWWYVPIIPVLLFPWSFSWPAWKNTRSVWQESPVRLCVLWCISSCMAFSLLSGKQIHYLLPIVPILALLISRLLTTLDLSHVVQLQRWIAGFLALCAVSTLAVPFAAHHFSQLRPLVIMTPLWMGILASAAVTVAIARVTTIAAVVRRVTISSLFAWILINGMVCTSIRELIDLRQFATEIAKHQQANRSLAFLGKYHGQFNFLGRLHVPITEVATTQQLAQWVNSNPQGCVIMERDTNESPGPGLLAFREELRDTHVRRLELWSAEYAPTSAERLAATNSRDSSSTMLSR
jgi:4-amino-4-deoxy-L-arabinose transferase-like glycosyltransferase